jgi:putative transposase
VTEIVYGYGFNGKLNHVRTYYRWKKKYGGLGTSELRRLRQLEEENRRLKQMVADLSLDKHMLQEVLSKKL